MSFPTARDLPASSPEDCSSSGSWNLSPKRKYCRSAVHRNTVARKRDMDRGNCALLAKATGISRVISVPGSRYRRVANKTPPADRFSAVANSRNSSPLELLPRTKNGMEIGNRSQPRRSATDTLRRKGQLLHYKRMTHIDNQINRLRQPVSFVGYRTNSRMSCETGRCNLLR